jgi:excisionase family DNA binding protein
MAVRKPAALTARALARRKSGGSNVLSAQVLADFCEVDLKTVHHWADRGKVPHFRTDGRHLRFRRNDVVRFLRAHDYPLPDALVRARPTVALALGAPLLEGASLSLEDLGKRLGSRFSVRRHPSGVAAIAHLVSEEPDAIVIADDDTTLGFPSALAALKEDPVTAWVVLVLVTSADGETRDGSRAAGADIVLSARDIIKLPGELARMLAIA